MYVNEIFPSSKNSILSIALFLSSKFALVFVFIAFLYISETFIPDFKSLAANSNVSGLVDTYWKPPVSVIIPVNIHFPISFVISIPKYSNIVNNICVHAGESGFT